MKKIIPILIIPVFLVLAFNSCKPSTEAKKAKYIFLFIGDGMGIAHVNTTEAYLAAVNDEGGLHHLSFTQFPAVGFASTYSANRFITGSAAAGTSLATGKKTYINRISMDSTGTISFNTIAERCRDEGMKTGIVTSVSIDHATPAVFYAHQPLRSMYFEIGMDLSRSNFDYFGGGGFRIAEHITDADTLNLFDEAISQGYQYVNSRENFEKLDENSEKVLAVSPWLADGSSLNYSLDMSPMEITLAEFTEKGIRLLENEKGFFMMVEGGKIDWAAHANDAASIIHETIAFDDAVKSALEFYKDHPNETLIVVTADHETGGLTLGNRVTKYEMGLSLLQYQKISEPGFLKIIDDFREKLSGDQDADFNKMMKIIGAKFGLGHKKRIPLTEEETKIIYDAFISSMYPNQETVETSEYSSMEPLGSLLVDMLNEKAGIGWSTGSHTGVSVPVYAIGVGAENFSGNMDNTNIPEKVLKIMNFEF